MSACTAIHGLCCGYERHAVAQKYGICHAGKLAWHLSLTVCQLTDREVLNVLWKIAPCKVLEISVLRKAENMSDIF